MDVTRAYRDKLSRKNGIFFASIAFALTGALLFFSATSVFAARGINSFTLNGGSSVTVFPNDNIAGVLNVTTTGTTGETDDWESTRWRISDNPSSGGKTGCDSTPNVTSATTTEDSITLNAPSAPGTYNVYITLYSNNSCGGQSDGPMTYIGAVTVSDPDLVVTKSNNVSGIAVIGVSFNWILTITNSGVLPANFGNNEKIVTDQLPTSNATYGTPTFVFGGGAAGSDTTCSISSGKMLTCTSHSLNNVSIPAGGTMTIIIPVTPTAIGTGVLVNPKSGGTCKVDPDTNIGEIDENNNNCNINSVTVSNPGHIVIDKITNPSGDSQSFNFDATGGMYADFTLTDTDVPNDQTLAPGNYSVSETVPNDWVQSSAACISSIGDSETIGAIELDSNETVTCTFTNTKRGSLTINKVIVPADDTGLFNLQIDGTTAGTGTNVGNGSTTGAVWVSPNIEHTVGETSGTGTDLSDYTAVIGGDCDAQGHITMSPGESKTCTITNTKKATLIIKKVMEGGTATFNFTGTPSGNISTDNGTITTSVISGEYTATETAISGWDLTSVSCDDGDSIGSIVNHNAVFHATAGETIICAFTNTKRATLNIQKISDPETGSFQFDLSGPAQTGMPATHTFTPGGTWNVADLLHGLYSLTETILAPENWTGSQHIACNGNGDNDPSGSIASPFALALNPGEDMSCTINNTQDAIITGKKFEDSNADGIAGEDAGLSGWTITAEREDDPETEEVESGSSQTTTDEGGNYTLRLSPGTYKICETLQSGWYQSYPIESTEHSVSCADTKGYELSVAAADNINGIDFGNYQKGSISGVKFEDKNGNTVKDEDEPGLEGWTIDISDGVSTTTAETNEDGMYTFENLIPGSYTVSEEQQTGWMQTTANPAAISIQSGTAVEHIDFGNFKLVTITGFKWDDKNGDGVWQKNDETNPEPGLQDVTIALGRVSGTAREENGHETVPIEIIAMSLTGTDGSFAIHDVGPGRYKLFEEQNSGWQPTSPAAHADSFFDITYRIDLEPQQKPLVHDSFFDVFVEVSGQNVNQREPTTGEGTIISVPGVALEFGNHKLLVISEDTESDVGETSLVVQWTTDRPGTSRVVYDTVSHPTLGSAPNYGYASSTAEQDLDPKVTAHALTITGLTAGTTYYYRTISKASPESISDEETITTTTPVPPPPPPPPPPPAPANNAGSSDGGGGGGGTQSASSANQNQNPSPSASPATNLAASNEQQQSGTSATESPKPVSSPAAIVKIENQSNPSPQHSAAPENKNPAISGENQTTPFPSINENSESNEQNRSFAAAIASFVGTRPWMIAILIAAILTIFFGWRLYSRRRAT